MFFEDMKIPVGVIGGVIVVVLVCWIGRGFWSNKSVKRPVIVSSEQLGSIEKRTVAGLILASVTIPVADQNTALYEGFRQLAGYIFGGNTSSSSVAMTAPVTTTKQSEKIAMTAPVTSLQEGSGYVVSFVMPSEYTLETLPKPNNATIRFVQQPQKTYYVWQFGWYANEKRANAQLAKFKDALQQQNLFYDGPFTLAQYDDPWTPPRMRTNERRVEVK